MGDFRKRAKENSLKPGRVSIPQIDPMSDIEQYNTPRSNKPSPAVPGKEVRAPESQKRTATTSEPAKQSEKPAVELASLFAKIPKDEKRWLDHHRIDTGKELGQIITEAIQLLKNQGKK